MRLGFSLPHHDTLQPPTRRLLMVRRRAQQRPTDIKEDRMGRFLVLDTRAGQYLAAEPSPFAPAVWSPHRDQARSYTRARIRQLAAHWPYLRDCLVVPRDWPPTNNVRHPQNRRLGLGASQSTRVEKEE